MNCKKMVWRMVVTKLHHRHFPCKFLRFDKFFWMMIFKVFPPCKAIIKVDIKILPQLISLWRLYYLKSQINRQEELLKKGVLKNFTKFTGKHLRQGLFSNKAAGWKSVTSLNTESRVFFRKILGFYYKWTRQLFYD